MHERSIQASYRVYDSISDMSAEDQELLTLARDSLSRSYAPYSNFQVAAAARMQGGEILVGTNQENAAYGQCLCAEQNVLANAGSNLFGEPVTALAVTARHSERKMDYPVTPCGACRQVIREHEDRNKHHIRVILQGESGEIFVFETVKDLLPLSFSGKDIL